MKNYQQSFLKIPLLDKILNVFVPTTLILVILVSFLFITQYKKEQTQYIYDSLYESSSNKALYLSDQLDFNVNLLRALTTFSDIYSMDRDEQEAFFTSRAAILGYGQFFVVDTKGKAYFFGTKEEKDISKEALFTNISSNSSYITEPYYENGEPIMTICAAIMDESYIRVGTLCATFNLSYIQDIIASTKTSMSLNSFVVNEAGEYIAVNNSESEAKLGNELRNGKNDIDVVNDAFASKSDKEGIIKVNGIEYYASATYMSNTKWCLVEFTETDVLKRHIFVLQIGEILISVLLGLLLFAHNHTMYSLKNNYIKLYTDSLCGCGSRAACLEQVEKMESIRSSKGGKFAVLYMDLNNFKMVNDTLGHEKGDTILKIFAEVLMKHLSKYGFVGRMGGDEFVGLFENVSRVQINNAIKAIDRELENRSKRLRFDYVISASYGYVDSSDTKTKTVEEMVHLADAKMYDDKREKKTQ